MAIGERPAAGASGKKETAQDARDLEILARSLGADIYGVASVEAYATEFPNKPQPTMFVPDAKSVIIIGMPQTPELWATVARPQMAGIPRSGADEAAGQGSRRMPRGAERYFVDSEQAMLTNELLRMAYKISWTLHRDGSKAFYFHPFKQEPRFKTAPFYFMPAMYLAGIGQMGLNCSILTPEYGPRIWVTAIITDRELPAGEPAGPKLYEDCQSCRVCVERCPSHSLDGEGWKNVHGCAAYGCCGSCVSVCPVGIT